MAHLATSFGVAGRRCLNDVVVDAVITGPMMGCVSYNLSQCRMGGDPRSGGQR